VHCARGKQRYKGKRVLKDKMSARRGRALKWGNIRNDNEATAVLGNVTKK